jgi:hypothetical protein
MKLPTNGNISDKNITLSHIHPRRVCATDPQHEQHRSDYVSERMNGDLSLWAPVKKEYDVHAWQQEVYTCSHGLAQN